MRDLQRLRNVIRLIALNAVMALVFCMPAHGETYRRTESLPPLRMGVSDLFRAVDRLRALMGCQAEPRTDCAWHDTIKLTDGKRTVIHSDGFNSRDLSSIPDFVTEADYRGSAEASPATSVWVYLSDDLRFIEVQGTSAEHVDAVVGLLLGDLRQFNAVLGGDMQRFLGGPLLLLIGAGLLGTTIPFRHRRSIRFAVATLGAVFIGSSLVVVGFDWPPGFAMFAGEPSLLARHAPVISFGGVILTLVTFLVSLGFSSATDRFSDNSKRHQSVEKRVPPA